MTTAEFRKYLAIGTGVGIEIGAEDLHVVVVRTRPSGARIVGGTIIAHFRNRPASEWGTEYATFLKKNGGGYLSATVLLPRRDVVVRQISLPGVANRDLAAAIAFQVDSLHPFAEDDAAYDYARVGNGPAVMLGITRRTLIEEYSRLFTEAGIKVASFTFSAAVLYSALRLFSTPPSDGCLGVYKRDGETELYGESPSRPVFSAAFSPSVDHPEALAAAELRLAPETEPAGLDKLLPAPRKVPADFDFSLESLPYATALAGACPWLSLKVNLLPATQRTTSSRLMYIPAAMLAFFLLLALVALGMQAPLDDRRYLAAIEAEAAKIAPVAAQASKLDREIEAARNRSRMLDAFRMRSKTDLDALGDLTRLIAPPTWTNSLELTRTQLNLAGEAEQAAGLLKIIDSSSAFQNSEFTIPLVRTSSGEVFRLRAQRKGAK